MAQRLDEPRGPRVVLVLRPPLAPAGGAGPQGLLGDLTERVGRGLRHGLRLVAGQLDEPHDRLEVVQRLGLAAREPLAQPLQRLVEAGHLAHRRERDPGGVGHQRVVVEDPPGHRPHQRRRWHAAGGQERVVAAVHVAVLQERQEHPRRRRSHARQRRGDGPQLLGGGKLGHRHASAQHRPREAAGQHRRGDVRGVREHPKRAGAPGEVGSHQPIGGEEQLLHARRGGGAAQVQARDAGRRHRRDVGQRRAGRVHAARSRRAAREQLGRGGPGRDQEA